MGLLPRSLPDAMHGERWPPGSRPLRRGVSLYSGCLDRVSVAPSGHMRDSEPLLTRPVVLCSASHGWGGALAALGLGVAPSRGPSLPPPLPRDSKDMSSFGQCVSASGEGRPRYKDHTCSFWLGTVVLGGWGLRRGC